MMNAHQYRSRALFAQTAADAAADAAMRGEWEVMAAGWRRLAVMAEAQGALAASLAAPRIG